MASTAPAPSGSSVPQPAPPPGAHALAPPADPVGTITLARLLEVAWLTPAQAVLVAALALERAGAARGSLDPAAIVLTDSGEVLVEGDHRPGPGAAELLAVLRREAHVRTNARTHHPALSDDELLHGLDVLAAGGCPDPAGAATDLWALLHAHGHGGGRLSTQLGALVRQARLGFAAAASGDHRPDEADRAVPARPRDQHHRRVDHGHHTRRGRLLGALAALVVVVLLTAGYFTLTGQTTALLHRVLGPHHPAGTSSTGTHRQARHPTSTRHHARPVTRHHHRHRFGPLSAGPVHGVSVQAPGCVLGAACTVRVTVATDPATGAAPVSWRVGVVDRCGRRTSWSPVTSVTPLTGWTSVYATTTVTLPRVHRTALVARTTAPARAASHLLPLPGGHC